MKRLPIEELVEILSQMRFCIIKHQNDTITKQALF